MTKKARAASLVAVAVAGLLVTGGGRVDATFSGTTGRIAFTSSASGSFIIFNPTGTFRDLALVSGEKADWSPDGKKLAFVAKPESPKTDVFTANLDGTDVRRLTNDGTATNPVWNKDGSKVIFQAAGANNQTQIFAINADGSARVALTSGSVAATLPAYGSNDKIAFIRGGDIHQMNADGTNATLLKDYPDGVTVGSMDWKPDATALVVHHNQPGGQGLDVYVVQAADGTETNLTNRANAKDAWPSFSPAGNQIAFVSNKDGSEQIYTMNVDGTNQTKVSNESGTPTLSDVAWGTNPITNATTALPPAGQTRVVPPQRLLDTRSGVGLPNNQAATIAADSSIDIQITGRGTIPSHSVAGADMNITVTQPASGPGFLTVFPAGQARPNSSNVNFVAGQTIPNLATVQVGKDGKVTLYNGSQGTVHVIFDIGSWIS